MDLPQKELTERIIGCFYKVYNALGFGFLEKVYERALLIELKSAGLSVVAQSPIKVRYNGEIVGEYYADIVVENAVILELKSSEAVIDEHEKQLLNYLRSTEVEVGLLLNFGKRPEIRRKIFTNDRKLINRSM